MDKEVDITKLEKVTNSYELLQVLNHFRVEAGEKPYRNHTDMMVKVKAECEDFDAHDFIFLGRINNLGKEVQDKYFNLTREQVFLTSMRESKKVRKSVYNYITKLEEENRVLNDLIAQTFKEKAWIGQEFALKAAGIKHPRITASLIKNSPVALKRFMKLGWFSHRQISKNSSDRVWSWSQQGFKYLVENKEAINERVSIRIKQKRNNSN